MNARRWPIIALAAIGDVVNPAVERLATFIDGPYRAKAPAAVGLAQYPGGRAYYQFLFRRTPSLTVTPEQIHELVPGHHFQIGLQRENASRIPYRRNGGFTAFTEAGRSTPPTSRARWGCMPIRTRAPGGWRWTCSSRRGSSSTPA